MTTNKDTPFDLDGIRRTWRILFAPGQVVELRALAVAQRYGRSRTVSGYFDSPDALVQAAVSIGASAHGVYVTLNELDPALLARRRNRAEAVEDREPVTADSNVIRRRWLLVDLDPNRPSGISSSDDEHAAALERGRQVREELRARGWPEPLFADSGNGAHLLYRIDLPGQDGHLIERCLAALDQQFSDGIVSVDVKVGNPARISKLYGTMARKGEDVPERPHRMARIMDEPERVTPVAAELLAALARGAPDKSVSAHANSHPGAAFDLAGWISAHDLIVDGPAPWEGGKKWIFAVCPWQGEHRNRSAWVIQMANGAISAGCHHDGCRGKDWAALRTLLEPDRAGTRDGGHESGEGGSAAKPSQAAVLVGLADEAGAIFWHTPGEELYATILRRGHAETIPLKGRAAEQWLRFLYHEQHPGQAPNSQAVTDALAVLRARALFAGDEHEVYVRVGRGEGDSFLDMGAADWSAVRISARGWEVVTNSPVKFRRPRGMLALPTPVTGAAIRRLRRFVNVADETDFRLLVTAIVAMFFPSGPYPVIVLGGEQGSAKSTTASVIRALVDPNSAPLRSQPRDEHDLVIAARNGWLLNFDNLSGISPWLSDGICRLATGGGFATRELYSDSDEILFQAQRPIIVNGIDDLATRGDLLDRALVFVLPVIAEDDRQTEEAFWAAFESERQALLGALLDLVAVALRETPGMNLTRLPRLADFARRGAALAPALGWTAASFLEAYDRNRAGGQAAVLEDSPVAQAVTGFIQARQTWSGSATDLLAELNEALGGDERARPARWPKGPQQLSNDLRRLAPNLRADGIDVKFERDGGRGRKRRIGLSRSPDKVGLEVSEASEASASGSNGADDLADEFAERPEQASSSRRFESDTSDTSDAFIPAFGGGRSKPCVCPTCPGTVGCDGEWYWRDGAEKEHCHLHHPQPGVDHETTAGDAR